MITQIFPTSDWLTTDESLTVLKQMNSDPCYVDAAGRRCSLSSPTKGHWQCCCPSRLSSNRQFPTTTTVEPRQLRLAELHTCLCRPWLCLVSTSKLTTDGELRDSSSTAELAVTDKRFCNLDTARFQDQDLALMRKQSMAVPSLVAAVSQQGQQDVDRMSTG